MLSNTRVRIVAIGVFAVTLLATACDAGFRTTPVSELLGKPARYEGRAVKVSGEVTNVLKLPFMSARFFTLTDSTGEITVITYEQLPIVHAKVTVDGVFSTVAISGAGAIGAHLTVGSPRVP
jgi:hypothetical protein